MYLIGITGGSGSGKTTFAKKVLTYLNPSDVAVLSMDSYYLDDIPKSLYTPKGGPNYDHPDAFDWDYLTKHIQMLKNNEPVLAPIYNFETNSRSQETEKIGPAKMIIFEGIFSLHSKTIRSFLDISCFLSVDADIRFSRRLHRDIKERGRSLESVISQYYDTVRPMHQKFLEPQKQFADFIVGEETDKAAKILAARLNEMLLE